MGTEDIAGEIQRSLGRIEASLEALKEAVDETKVRVSALEKFKTLVLINFAVVAASIYPATSKLIFTLLH